jgi:uncharacterized membrane protein
MTTTAPLSVAPARWSVPYADTLARVGRFCFAGGMIGFAIGNVMVGDFIVGRPPAWPAGLPGKAAFAYVTAALFIVAAVWVARGARTIWPLVCVSATIAAWAFLRNVPLAIADHQFGGAWTNLGKALALSGGTLGVAASLLRGEPSERSTRLDLVGRCSLGAFFVMAGIQHFKFAPFVQTLVPAWIPAPLLWTYVGGVALFASGIGLMLPPTKRFAAAFSGLMLLTWVIVLHIPRGLTINNQNEWTAVIEALTFGGIALAMVSARTLIGDR